MTNPLMHYQNNQPGKIFYSTIPCLFYILELILVDSVLIFFVKPLKSVLSVKPDFQVKQGLMHLASHQDITYNENNTMCAGDKPINALPK